MKTNTIKRANMSKERVRALDELLPQKSAYYDSAPGVYLRSDKDRELDVLWQGFKINHREERSPGFYLTAGFATGAICTIVMTLILNLGLPKKINFTAAEKPIAPASVNVTPSTPLDGAQITKSAQYTVSSGDTLGAIAFKFYGTSSPDKIAKIQKANNMKTPDDLQINQKLVIPVED